MTSPIAIPLAPLITSGRSLDPICGASARRAGFTLIELVVSMAIMSILMLGIGSAIKIASMATPKSTSATVSQAEAAAALDQLSADLLCATAITELTATAVTMTVADRGHGNVGGESIRYAWSGVAGAALTRQYNTSAAKTIASNVSAFALSSERAVGQLTSLPRVLMFVSNISLLSTDDQARKDKLTSWNFPVTLIEAWATQTQFNTAIANCDVVYAPEGVYWFSLSSLFDNPSVGIVNENEGLYSQIGISTSMQIDAGNDEIDLINTTHLITRGLSMGNMIVSTSNADLHITNGTLASGAQALANQKGGSGYPALVVIECGNTLSNSQTARGRRVVLPWGGQLLNPFSFTQLNAAACTLLKRSLVWAAAPPVYRSVSVKLTVGAAPAASVRIELVNQPRVPTP